MASSSNDTAETSDAPTTAPTVAVTPTSGATPAWEQHRQAIREEYGQYEATSPIYVGNALAYNPGDQVPASNVERFHYLEQGLVKKVDKQQ